MHDVFVSYPRRGPARIWLKEFFLDVFASWLGQELGGRDARIFLDEEMETGTPWPDRLRAALDGSKVLVPVWLPGYFQSPWCMYEWNGFRARGAPVLPIRFHDGDSFPEEARRTQMADFQPYAYTAAGFRLSRKFMKFEQRVKEFAVEAARAVGVPPPPAPIPPPVPPVPTPAIPLAQLG